MTTTYPYLGTPGAMQQLPGPNGDITAPPARSETIHKLLSGGSAKTQRLVSKREFTLPYINRPSTGLDDLLLSFYDGVFDVPGTDFVYVNPVVENVLPLDVSQFGLRSVAPLSWAVSAGTLAWDTATTPPPVGIAPTAVVKWSGAAASAILNPGTSTTTADPGSAPVILTDQPITISLYVMASSAGSFSLRAPSFNANGSSNTVQSASINVTTSWQRFSLTVNAGALAGALVLPRLRVPTASPPASVWVCGAQVEYGSSVSPFSRGYGSPRVLVSSSPGDTRQKWDGYSEHTLTLAEV